MRVLWITVLLGVLIAGVAAAKCITNNDCMIECLKRGEGGIDSVVYDDCFRYCSVCSEGWDW